MSARPNFKLGKRPAKQDSRNLLFADLLRAVPKLPATYDFDLTHLGIPLPMFSNSTLGCCVMSARAHQTLRFEDVEQKTVIPITDSDVTTEYFRETGGADNGLVILDSLGLWRKSGWKAAGKVYKINAYAQIQQKNQVQVQQAIYADVGIQVGLMLPMSAQREINAGQPWQKTTGSGTVPGSWGGHCVLIEAWDTLGPVCVTWARKQRMSWQWFVKYCDEAYAVFDAKDTAKRFVDRKKIAAFLETVS